MGDVGGVGKLSFLNWEPCENTLTQEHLLKNTTKNTYPRRLMRERSRLACEDVGAVQSLILDGLECERGQLVKGDAPHVQRKGPRVGWLERSGRLALVCREGRRQAHDPGEVRGLLLVLEEAHDGLVVLQVRLEKLDHRRPREPGAPRESTLCLFLGGRGQEARLVEEALSRRRVLDGQDEVLDKVEVQVLDKVEHQVLWVLAVTPHGFPRHADHVLAALDRFLDHVHSVVSTLEEGQLVVLEPDLLRATHQRPDGVPLLEREGEDSFPGVAGGAKEGEAAACRRHVIGQWLLWLLWTFVAVVTSVAEPQHRGRHAPALPRSMIDR
eukprot:scaffold16805_cov59-Phaeocystis_antarctica.AAC.3